MDLPAWRGISGGGPNASVELSFRLVRPTKSNGTPLGESMEGYFDAATNPGASLSYTINNRIGDQYYFAPLITNRTSDGGLMMVNGGLTVENRCDCVVPAGGVGVGIGYYRWYTNSNVRAYAPGIFWLYVGAYVQWRPVGFESESGVSRLVMNP